MPAVGLLGAVPGVNCKNVPTVVDPVDTMFAGKSTVIVPDVVIGLPVITNAFLATVTPVTVPPVVVVEIVTAPLLPLKLIPVPALNRVTPVLTMLIVPDVVIGLPVTCIPAPGVTEILVTVPELLPLAMLVTRPYWSTVIVG